MELRSAIAPDEPAATGERSRIERGITPGAARSERPCALHAPILFPAGQMPVAKLQGDCGVRGIKPDDAGRSIGEEDFRAGPAGMVDEGCPKSEGGFCGSHAEGERKGVGLEPAIDPPANPKGCRNASHRARPRSVPVPRSCRRPMQLPRSHIPPLWH